jgi:hypothetical protein
MEACAVAMGFVITPEFTTPASTARNDIATTATADAIAILVKSDSGIEVPIGRASPGG